MRRPEKSKAALLAVVAAASVLTLSSCGKDDGKTAEARNASQGAPSADAKVTIVPADPTAESEVRAVYSGSAVTLSYRWEVNGKPVLGVNGDALASGSFAKGDVVKVTVSSHGVGRECEVRVANTPPVVTGVKPPEAEIAAGRELAFQAEAEDRDNDDLNLRYIWVINGDETDAGGDGTLAQGVLKRGDVLNLRADAYDGTDWSAPLVAGPYTVKNARPFFTSTPPASFSALKYAYEPQAVDADGDKLIFALDEGPEGMKVTDTGKIEWDLAGAAPGGYQVQLTVSDGNGGKDTQSYLITIGGQEPNEDPL